MCNFYVDTITKKMKSQVYSGVKVKFFILYIFQNAENVLFFDKKCTSIMLIDVQFFYRFLTLKNPVYPRNMPRLTPKKHKKPPASVPLG